MSSLLHALLLVSLAMSVLSAIAFPLNVRGMPRLSRPRRPDPASWPRVSIVVPARNEERTVETGVRSHLAQEYPGPPPEVVVVDDRSTDATRAIVETISREDPRLRVVDGGELPEGWLGKPHALHQGAAAASGDLLLFADADVVYSPAALAEAVRLLEADRIDFLSLFPALEMHGFWENVLMPNIPISFFFGLGFLANSDRHRWMAAGGGAGNLVRRSAYEAAGGHAAIRDSVIDDIRLAMAVKRAGFRCRIALADDRVAVRMYRGFREVWNGFTKNVAFVFAGGFGLLFLLGTALTWVAALAPVAALIAWGLGLPVSRGDVGLAVAALLLTTLLRALLAKRLAYPQWTAWTQPLMTAVWGGLIVRSLYWRFVRRELRWRGRGYDAQRARF
ncbi:MAG TPA: glycosyltransferase [Thermoanaerobaculia bacterium]|jgi:chlorobactene glucosyltransferase